MYNVYRLLLRKFVEPVYSTEFQRWALYSHLSIVSKTEGCTACLGVHVYRLLLKQFILPSLAKVGIVE